MLELSAWAGLEPAILDVKTVSGLAQVFELTLTDSAGSEADLSGVSFRGAVNTAPLQEFVCAVEGGKLLFGWSCLPAGRHSFDLFVVIGATERALVRGTMVVAGRVVPPLGEGGVVVNDAATLVLPDTVDGVIRVELSEAGLVDLLSRRAGAFADGAEAALKSIEELKRWIGEKVEGFGSVADAAVKAVTDAGTEAVSAVEGTGTVATEAVKAAKDQAVQSVREEKGTAVKAVTDAGTEAVSAVEGTGTVATEAVKAAKDQAVQSVREEKGTAVKAVTDAGTEAESSIAGMVQKATDASTTAQTAQTAAEAAAERAGTSATSAASAATAAQQALDAIPQVDAGGNMTLAGGLTTAATINANGGINIPVAPSMDTQAARFREVQLLQEMEFSPLRTYFKSPNPVPFGVLLDRFWWAANRDNMPAWTVATAEFSQISPDYLNFDYDSLTSCYFPMSCGLGFGRCFDSIAIGNVAFNADYASLDGDPFVTPADYMRYWVDVQIGRPANAQCSVFVRMFRWDRDSASVVNTEHGSTVPDSLALRGVALSMTSEFSGVWLVGFDKKVGRLVSYKVLPEMFEGDSYVGLLSNNRLSLAKVGGHVSVGVHAPRYYGGTVVGEWCSLIQAN